jgi:hypothetical protein
VALADAVVVARVAAIEEATVQAFPLMRVRGGSRVPFKMARLHIERVLLGKAGPEQVRVGVGPGPRMPLLKEGQSGCFFLHRHPDEPFLVLSAGSDFIDSKRKDHDEALALVTRCAALLANTDEALRSADGDGRLLTAAMLVFRYRTPRHAYSGPPRTEPIDAEQSRRILAVLKEGSFSDKAARDPTGRLTLFLRLGLAEDDGWKPPPRLPDVGPAAEKWLAAHADTYSIRRYIPEEPASPEADPGPPERQARGGTSLPPWPWLAAALACVLAAAGYAIYRRRRPA